MTDCSRFWRMAGMPAERSLLRSTTHGSKSPTQTVTLAFDRLERKLSRHRGARSSVGRCDFGQQAADADVQSRMPQDRLQRRDILQVENICACGSRESAARCVRRGRFSQEPPSSPARRAAWNSGFRLLKPPGNRFVSTGASLKPLLRKSTEQ